MSSPRQIPQVLPTLPAPIDLRHMTSNPTLTPVGGKDKRTSQHMHAATRKGSRSPTSIPSSPTSVHSSSSAIFERDIEPLSASPTIYPHAHTGSSTLHPPTNPHRIPRAKSTEPLDQSVPSVLDSAAAILTSLQDPNEEISVVAPLPPGPGSSRRGSGFASPRSIASIGDVGDLGEFRSRSPSPHGTRVPQPPSQRTSLLLNIPPHSQVISSAPVHINTPIPTLSPSPPVSGHPSSPTNGGAPTAKPIITTSIPPPDSMAEVATPTSTQFSTAESSPITTTREIAPPLPTASPHSVGLSPPVSSPVTPPSPNVITKRLSFISYSDLVQSTPASTLPLSLLTTNASIADGDRPHIPVLTPVLASAGSGSLHSHSQMSSQAGSPVQGFTPLAQIGSGDTHSLRNFSGVKELSVANPPESALLDDVGGEWEREGLGQGLEERVEGIMISGKAPSVNT